MVLPQLLLRRSLQRQHARGEVLAKPGHTSFVRVSPDPFGDRAPVELRLLHDVADRSPVSTERADAIEGRLPRTLIRHSGEPAMLGAPVFIPRAARNCRLVAVTVRRQQRACGRPGHATELRLNGLAQVLQNMKTIGDLPGLRRASRAPWANEPQRSRLMISMSISPLVGRLRPRPASVPRNQSARLHGEFFKSRAAFSEMAQSKTQGNAAYTDGSEGAACRSRHGAVDLADRGRGPVHQAARLSFRGQTY